jgi:UDP-glucose 4-epimerase
MVKLVTGASGFLGRNLVRTLASRGERVVALHRRQVPPFQMPQVTWHKVDVTDSIDWNALLADVEQVYHLAWSTLPQSSNESPSSDAVVNIGGTLKLLEALRSHPKPRLVFASSGGTRYGSVESGCAHEDMAAQPRCAYGVSKQAVESYLSMFERLWGIDHVSLRFSNAFGPDQETGRNFGVVATFVARALGDQVCTIYGDGQTERDFLYVDDAVSAMIAAGEKPLSSRAYNIGSGEGRSIFEVVEAIRLATGRDVRTIAQPAREFDAPRTVLDASRAERELGWKAGTTFEQGLEKVIAAHRGDCAA